MANAILMASGLGSRMRPLTNTTPKPLIKVNNTPMIETVINALEMAGVEQIFIVVGYLGEQFKYLTDKYTNVSIINNTDYETVNNISSIYYAREEMKKSDLYISDTAILQCIDKSKSGYCGIMVEGHSDDWVFEQDSDGIITRVGKVGDNCFNMCGLSYFNKEQALLIANEIERIYGNKGQYEDLLWDDVVNSIINKLNLTVFGVNANQIVGVDTVEELEAINKRFI